MTKWKTKFNFLYTKSHYLFIFIDTKNPKAYKMKLKFIHSTRLIINLRIRMPIIFLNLLIVIFTFCNNEKIQNIGNSGFELSKPDKTIILSSELNEISGIDFYKDGQLICQQDENANLYFVDRGSGKLKNKIEIPLIGDFEDIQMVDSTLYMLKNNGTIYEFNAFKLSEGNYTKYPTILTQKNDTEGLGFDKKTNSLLIACKSKPGIDDTNPETEKTRNIYQFNLQTKKLSDQAFLKINLGEIAKYGIQKFMPSGIAVHPLTGYFYIISANSKALLVYDRENKIISATKLNPKLFQQPEGICFDPEGKYLIISNEGKQSKPNILIFNKL